MYRLVWLLMFLFLVVGNLVEPSYAKYGTDGQWGRQLGEHLKLYEREQRDSEKRWKDHLKVHKKENELARKQLEKMDELLKVLQAEAKSDHDRIMRKHSLSSIQTSMSSLKSDYRSLSYRY